MTTSRSQNSSVTGGDVRALMEAWAPPSLAESWDNVGWQVGYDGASIRGILVALDVDHGVLDEALDKDANLIVAHHPLLFKGVKRIDPTAYEGRMLKRLLCDQVHVFASHTNLDSVLDGVNGALAEALGLTPHHPLRPRREEPTRGLGALCSGEGVTATAMAKRVAERLESAQPRLTLAIGEAERLHEEIALLGGSGADLIEDVLATESRLFITGELKYHEAQGAARAGLSVIEAGHYFSEQPVLPRVAARLSTLGVPVHVAECITSPFASHWEEDQR